MRMPEPKHAIRAFRGDEGDETTYDVHVYDAEDVLEYLDIRPSQLRTMDSHELADELGHGGGRFYRGPGQAFSHGAYAYLSKRGTRVLVKQSFALDI